MVKDTFTKVHFKGTNNLCFSYQGLERFHRFGYPCVRFLGF